MGASQHKWGHLRTSVEFAALPGRGGAWLCRSVRVELCVYADGQRGVPVGICVVCRRRTLVIMYAQACLCSSVCVTVYLLTCLCIQAHRSERRVPGFLSPRGWIPPHATLPLEGPKVARPAPFPLGNREDKHADPSSTPGARPRHPPTASAPVNGSIRSFPFNQRDSKGTEGPGSVSVGV